MIQFLIALALCYVLIKIPFWVLSSVRSGQRRSVIGSITKAYIAAKTLGTVGGTGRAAASAAGKSVRIGASGLVSKAGVGLKGSVSAVQRWHQRHQARWIRPEPGMLPMRLRRPGSGHITRRSLADDLDDPQRIMPYQQPPDPKSEGLLGPRGGINDRARPPRRIERPIMQPEPGMLPLRLRPNAAGVPYGPAAQRRSLSDDLREGTTRPPASPDPEQPGLLYRTGRARPAARPPRLDQPLRFPEPGMLPLTVRQPRSQPSPPPAEPADPAPNPPRQPGLFNRYGQPTRAAMPLRRPRRPDPPQADPPRPRPGSEGREGGTRR